jgi:hypothetical protein
MTVTEIFPDLVGELIDVERTEAEDLRLASVTSILDTLDRAGLRYWMRNSAIDAALDNLDELRQIASVDRKAAASFLRDRIFSPKDQRSATQLGSDVHEAIRLWLLDGKRPDVDEEVRRYLDVFERDFLLPFRPEFEAAEMTIIHEAWNYAGTLDALGKVRGSRYVFDWKSSRTEADEKGKLSGPYPESALQVAAYRWAEWAIWRARRVQEWESRRFYLVGAEERAQGVAMPESSGGIVVHISPERARVHPVVCDEPVHRIFGFIREICRYQWERAPGAVHPPLEISRARLGEEQS